MNEQVEQKKLFREFENLLRTGKVSDALDYLTVNGLQDFEADPITNRVFEEFIKGGKPAAAIEIGRKFKLDSRKVQDAGAALFRQLLSKNQTKKALKVGEEFKLGKKELDKAALRYFNEAIKKKDLKSALEVTKRYQISHDVIYPIAIKGFNDAVKRRDYFNASFLGREFQLSRSRIAKVASKAIIRMIEVGEIDKIFHFHSGFDIFTDEGYKTLEEKEILRLNKAFVNGIVDRLLMDGQIEKTLKIIKGFKLFDKKHNVSLLNQMIEDILKVAAKHHNRNLEMRSIADSRVILEGFHLLSDFTPFEIKNSVIDQAQRTHVVYVKEKNFQAAKTIKKEYELFGKNSISNSSEIAVETAKNILAELIKKGDIAGGVEVIKDYQLPDSIAKSVACTHVIDLIKQKRIDEAIKGIKSFRIPYDEPKLLKTATIAFENALDSKLYEQAADLGYNFKLNKEATLKAAYNAWKRHMEYGRYDSAYRLFKRYKVPKRIIIPIVTDLYAELLEDGNAPSATKLRELYNLQVNFFQWFLEKVKNIFKKE